MVKFSIVFPIYNVELYLEKAIQQILNQTYTQLELILVNDCSPDDSIDICEKYTSLPNVKLVNLEENGGLSNARNVGISHATGDYILFLDSDDYVETNLLENIHNEIMSKSCDTVVYGLTEEYYDQGEIKYTKDIIDTYHYFESRQELLNYVVELERQTLFGYAWNKAYNLKVIKDNNLQFKKITMIEDVLFNLEYFELTNRCSILGASYYHYAIRNNGSLTSKYLANYFELHETRVKTFMTYLKKWNVDTKASMQIISNIYVRYLVSAIQRLYSKAAHSNFSKRCKFLDNVYVSDTYLTLLPYMQSDNKVLKVFMMFIKRKSKFLLLVLCYFVYVVKEKAPILFSKFKQNR